MNFYYFLYKSVIKKKCNLNYIHYFGDIALSVLSHLSPCLFLSITHAYIMCPNRQHKKAHTILKQLVNINDITKIRKKDEYMHLHSITSVNHKFLSHFKTKL